MPRFHNQRCFSVWNGFFGQVEFGLNGVPCLSHGIIYPFVADASCLQEMLYNARKVAEQKFKFLHYRMAATRVQIGKSWRTRLQPIRTFGEITAHIKILPVHQPYLYQKLSQKATQLRLLGMSYEQIAKSLNINKRTAVRACKYKAKN